MCNACGIRWKRAQETMPIKVEKTIKKRKKKKTELEALMSPDNNSISPPTNEKRLRTKPSIASSPHESDMPSATSHAATTEDDDDLYEEEDDDGSMQMEVDEEEEESMPAPSLPSSRPPRAFSVGSVQGAAAQTSWRPNESPFQPRSSASLPSVVGSATSSVPSPSRLSSSPHPSESPFPALASSPLVNSSVNVKREGKEAASAPHGIGIDLGLLREILMRLENLRKEHKKTTEQVQYMMEECRAHPELFHSPDSSQKPRPSHDLPVSPLNRPRRSSALATKGTRVHSDPPFPLSSSGALEDKPTSLPHKRN